MIGDINRLKEVLGIKTAEFLLALVVMCKKGNECDIEKEEVDSIEYYFQIKHIALLSAYNILVATNKGKTIHCLINREKINAL